MRCILLAAVALLAAACSHDPPGPAAANGAAPDPKQAGPTTTAASAGPLRLGAAISAPAVALADVAKDPHAFEAAPFSTTGTVTAVCQSMGCWMEIKDADNNAHIRMHGHSFFVPKTASGRKARVQATVVPAADEKECDEAAERGGVPKPVTRVELDATGIELL
jgi:hypothetical protein